MRLAFRGLTFEHKRRIKQSTPITSCNFHRAAEAGSHVSVRSFDGSSAGELEFFLVSSIRTIFRGHLRRRVINLSLLWVVTPCGLLSLAKYHSSPLSIGVVWPGYEAHLHLVPRWRVPGAVPSLHHSSASSGAQLSTKNGLTLSPHYMGCARSNLTMNWLPVCVCLFVCRGGGEVRLFLCTLYIYIYIYIYILNNINYK
jgi:hypothetical protein